MKQKINEAILQYQNGCKNSITEEIYKYLYTVCLFSIFEVCNDKYIKDDNEKTFVIPDVIITALETYDIQKKVSFISYLKVLMRNKIIDIQRKNRDFVEFNDAVNYNKKHFRDMFDNIHFKVDLYNLGKQLIEYKIDLQQIINTYPIRRDCKRKIVQFAMIIADNDFLTTTLLRTKKLPIKQLRYYKDADDNFFDRHRKYIITVALMLINNMVDIKEHNIA